MKKDKCVAIVLAGGKGRRMESDIPKQYLELNGKPIIYYSINQFQNSDIIDEIVLVTGKDEIQFCKDRIVDRYSFQKVKHIIEGGKERYHSVYNALQCINECDFVFIHDGARPFINLELINDLYKNVKEYQACVVGVQTKDTIKLADSDGFIAETPDRSKVWNIQTPQVFRWGIVKSAYDMLMKTDCCMVTDDAMVIEKMLKYKVKLVQGSYENIKVTTPSDLVIARAFLT
ncbi:2-C-methyl-D-erythritol 4-phosphate cytidylyltransferase [Lachnotalea glycerini]|nr:2-C-methyl-D-erythritol 4-phosphate cytidylyltransferase [Lachnotalea glycerini]PXV86740.1 2-C-methyl-D-erythritol 4-phosphate cytidylyltransferase [Lachnotalea glycerini]